MSRAATTFFSPGECQVCGIPPLLYVRNSLDDRIVLYCYDCGGIYSAPDGLELAYDGRPIGGVGTLVPIGADAIERAGAGGAVAPVSAEYPFRDT